MLPADTIAEIVSTLAGLQLDSNTTAAVLGAVLTPLQAEDLLEKKPARTHRHPPPKRKKPPGEGKR